ncbi:MAG TPA: rRNA maturation RNase YbeY [Candidatus Polarisedimenticolia bacterium]|nr:rRNA maturation RNase YbeY [Candidatus Polarisedimenticolia bacterium]
MTRVPAGRRLAATCRALLHRLLLETGRQGAGVTLLLDSEAALRRLNRRFLGRDRPTDVLSFPACGDLEPGRAHLGEIAISVPRAARQARRARWSLPEEIALLVTHGYLHLLGYDHETDDGSMRRLEETLLKRAAGVMIAKRGLPWGDRPSGRKRARARTSAPRRRRHG